MPHFGVRIAVRPVGSTALEFSDHADQFVEAGRIFVPALDDLVLHEGVLGSPLRELEPLVAACGDAVPVSRPLSFSRSAQKAVSAFSSSSNAALPTISIRFKISSDFARSIRLTCSSMSCAGDRSGSSIKFWMMISNSAVFFLDAAR